MSSVLGGCYTFPSMTSRLALAFVAFAASTAISAADRPATWAVAPPEPIPGLPNFHTVTPGLYRGAQPSAEGMRRLEAMGVKTVLSLRAFNDDESLLPQTKLVHPRIRFKTWHPEDEDVVRFLRIVTDPARAPVFVHCQHGSDRTGTMIAIYRVAIEGWTKDEAIREMVEGGYGFHPLWENLKTYIRRLDIEAIRREAGIR
jgi:protein tyrosine/serine phosphatase